MNLILQFLIRKLGCINAEQWRTALEYVLIDESKITEEEHKRAWVLDKLRNIGVTGRYANFAVEAALAWLKHTGRLE